MSIMPEDEIHHPELCRWKETLPMCSCHKSWGVKELLRKVLPASGLEKEIPALSSDEMDPLDMDMKRKCSISPIMNLTTTFIISSDENEFQTEPEFKPHHLEPLYEIKIEIMNLCHQLTILQQRLTSMEEVKRTETKVSIENPSRSPIVPLKKLDVIRRIILL